MAYLKQAQYSAKTLNRHLSALRGFYKWMQRKPVATDPIFHRIILERHEIFHILCDSDVNKLLESCDISTAVGLAEIELLGLYATGLVFLRGGDSQANKVDLQKWNSATFWYKMLRAGVPLYESAISGLKKHDLLDLRFVGKGEAVYIQLFLFP